MRDPVIVSAVRTAVGRAPRGALRETPPDALGMAAVREALARAPGLDPAEVEDVVLGCAMPEGGQGLNVARQVALGAGLPVSTAAMTVNRFCASGLQSLALAHRSVAGGVADVVVAGGVESMSAVPTVGWHYAPNPGLAERMPEVYLGMGLTGEEVARREGVDREAQDAWGLRSHRRAAAAQDAGLLPRRDRAGRGGADRDRGRPAARRDRALRRRRGHPPRHRRVPHGGAAAGLRPHRHRDRRQQLADERRGRRDGRDGRRAGRRAGPRAARPAGVVRDRRRRARGHGPGPGRGGAQGARQGGPGPRRHRRDRAERGLRRPGGRRRAAARDGRGAHQRQRRRDRAGASPRAPPGPSSRCRCCRSWPGARSATGW